MNKWIYKFLLVISIVLGILSLVRSSINSPADYYKDNYGEDYVLDVYDHYDTFKTDYPELVDDVDYYYNYVLNIKNAYDKENHDLQTGIRVLNGEVESASFCANIHDDYEDIGLFYQIHTLGKDNWEVYVSVDSYNIPQMDIWTNVDHQFRYLGQVLGLDLNDISIKAIAATHFDYYNVKTIEETVDGYAFEFYYNGQGDYTIHLSKVLPKRQK